MKKEPLEIRFWRKVDIRGLDQCWNWTGGCSNKGYGNVGTTGRKIGKAHRVAYALTFGDVPSSVKLCHRCDNRRCCNPFHLFEGTDLDNRLDCVRKGRHNPFRGKKRKYGVLTEEDIPHIRKMLKEGMSQGEIARGFLVDPTTIWAIVHGKTWSHI